MSKYLIINEIDFDDSHISRCRASGISVVDPRYNKDESQLILTLGDEDVGGDTLTREQIIELLKTPEWAEEVEE